MINCIDLERAMDGLPEPADTEPAVSHEGLDERRRGLGSSGIDAALEEEEERPIDNRPTEDVSVPLSSRSYTVASEATLKQLRAGLDKLSSPHSSEQKRIIREWIAYREAENDIQGNDNPAGESNGGDETNVGPSSSADLTDVGVAWRS